MTNSGAYQRLRELTRDNVLDELHPALRPDIVAVLDELATTRVLRADAEQSLRAQAQSYRDEIHELRDRISQLESRAFDPRCNACTEERRTGESREHGLVHTCDRP